MAAPLGANAAPPINNPQPRLPPEICERIIDHLRYNSDSKIFDYDGRTVLNCALVCRGWYPASRAVYFEEPELHTRKQAIACFRSLTQIPFLGARVRHLQIGLYAFATVRGPELASILVMLAGKLPKLAELVLDHVSFEHCSMSHTAFWSLHEFSHVTSLELHLVMLPSASPFVQVICSFPRLQSLRLSNLRWSEPRSMAPLPECHRMPLTTVTSLGYDLSCFEGIGHILLSLLDQAMLETLLLEPEVSAAALAFTQDMLNIAGKSLEMAEIIFSARGDAGENVQSLLLHPISFEANVNLQTLRLDHYTSKINHAALCVRSVLPMLESILSKDLKGIQFEMGCCDKWGTDAMLDAFDPEVCIQIDELLAEGHFPKLRDVSMKITLYNDRLEMDDSQLVGLCTEIGARFPKLIDKNMLTVNCGKHRFPSDAERALKAKQLADKQLHPAEQAAA